MSIISHEVALLVKRSGYHIPSRLTWRGHEFIDAAREPGRWQQAKDAIGTIGGASITVWISLLTAYMKQNLGLE